MAIEVFDPESATVWRVDTYRRWTTAEFLSGKFLYSMPPLQPEMALLLCSLVEAGFCAMYPPTRPKVVGYPGASSMSVTVYAPIKFVPLAERALVQTLAASPDMEAWLEFMETCQGEAQRWEPGTRIRLDPRLLRHLANQPSN